LWAPVDVSFLVFFRIFFGGMMVYQVYSYWVDGWIDFFYIQPVFHFTYPGFGWARPWPGTAMYAHFLVMGLAAGGILCGAFYRFSALVFWLTFTHTFLMEKALYQNHYYLICLVSFLMMFLPGHVALSVDARRRPGLRRQVVPAWTLWMLRAQLAIPYFYGGLAKLNGDWLHGMPLRLWLGRLTELPYAGRYFTEEWVVYFVTYGGLVYDLAVVPLLLWRRTRVFAYVVTLAFHLANSILFDIGIFPWFMIGATLLFFPPDWPRKLLRLPPLPDLMRKPLAGALSRQQQLTVTLLGAYLAWQLLFPLRHFVYPGDPSWTEEGHHFAWHMMLREKDVGIRFYVRNPATNKRGTVQVSSFLNHRQLSRMGKDADMILQFVHFVRDHYREHGRGNLEIRVLALASLNGRKPQLLLDPHLDYAKVERTWATQPWILPLVEPRRAEGWNVPLAEWESVLQLDLPEMFGTVQRDPSSVARSTE
jgi:hypothetical protein